MAGSLGDLVISIAADIAKLEVGMTRAEYLVDQTSQKIDKAMKLASDSVVAFAASFASFEAAKGFADQVQQAAELSEAFEKAGIKAGVASEQMSAFYAVGKLSETGLDQITVGLERLSRNMVEAASGTGKAASTFAALHLSVFNSSGAIKNAGDFSIEVAQKLAALGNETQKTAYTINSFGRAAAENKPFLADLAEAGNLHALSTHKQNEEAAAYIRTLRELQLTTTAFYLTISGQVVPVLDAVVRTIIQLRTETGGLNDTAQKLAAQNQIRQWAVEAALAVAELVDVARLFWFAMQNVGELVGYLATLGKDAFEVIANAIVFAATSMEGFADIIQGVAEIMSNDFIQGVADVKKGWGELKDSNQQFNDALAETWQNLKASWADFTKKIGDDAVAFNVHKVTEALFNQFGQMATALDKATKAGKDHATVIGQEVAASAYDKLIKQLDLANAKLAVQLDFIRQHGYELKQTSVATTVAALQEETMWQAIMKEADGNVVLATVLMQVAVARAAVNDALASQYDNEKAYADLVRSENNDLSNQVDRLQDQVATYGQLASGVTAYQIAKKEAYLATLDQDSQVAKDLQWQIDKLREIMGLQQQLEGLKAFNASVAEGANLVGKLAAGFEEGVTHGIENARNMWHQLVQEILALVAKKIFLNIAFAVTGESSIGAMAANAGAGSVANSVLGAGANYLAGLAGFGSAGTMGEFFGAMTGSIPSAAIGANAVAAGVGTNSAAAVFGNAVGNVLAAIPVWGWIAAAVVSIGAIAEHFRDRENWQATLGFGANAQAYASTGPFGAQGFLSIQGSDALNRQIQQFMANTVGIDQIIAGTLSAATIAQITTNLGAPYTTRNDGQPAQFAFGQNDNTAAQQLTLEFLQHKYGIIFDSIDKGFADFIRSFTGTAEDLLKKIGEESAVLKAIHDSTGLLHTLTPEALRAMAQGGESIGQTFTRIATTFAQFEDAFTSDADKLSAAQDKVASTFADLGVAVPTSVEDFRHLVEGLDLSTESGRHMFEQLMQIAPAFQTVANAAASARQQFVSIASSLSPAFATGNAQSNFGTALAAWNANLVAQGGTAWTAAQATANIQQWIASYGGLQGARAYAESLGTTGLSLLNAMLSAYQNINGGGSSSSSSGGSYHLSGATTALNGLANAANQAAQALQQARDSVADWISKTMLSSSLSPLTPTEQLHFAQDQYVATAQAALGGDVSAISRYTSMADAYLSAARSYYASGSQYNAIFAGVMMQASQIAGLADASRPVTAADGKANAQAIVDAINRLATQVGLASSNTDVKSLISTLTQAIREGSLTFS